MCVCAAASAYAFALACVCICGCIIESEKTLPGALLVQRYAASFQLHGISGKILLRLTPKYSPPPTHPPTHPTTHPTTTTTNPTLRVLKYHARIVVPP